MKQGWVPQQHYHQPVWVSLLLRGFPLGDPVSFQKLVHYLINVFVPAMDWCPLQGAFASLISFWFLYYYSIFFILSIISILLALLWHQLINLTLLYQILWAFMNIKHTVPANVHKWTLEQAPTLLRPHLSIINYVALPALTAL